MRLDCLGSNIDFVLGLIYLGTFNGDCIGGEVVDAQPS